MPRNMTQKKTPMPVRPAAERVKDFHEVAQGYTFEMAREEASRCLNCRAKPCVAGCPVAIDIPGFITCVARGDMEGAYGILSEATALPAVCGRVCPQETQCEALCVRAARGESVGIGHLERFVADWQREHAPAQPEPPVSNGRRVAIVGAGPSGLTAADELAKMGYGVTVFEALHLPGGVLTYGIPEFRLPKAVVMHEVDLLQRAGVEIACNNVIGKTLTIDELFSMGYEAVYIASGAGLPKFMGIPGESLNGVYSANEYLTRINLMKAWHPDSQTPIMAGARVAVIGGGNVAMDAARSAARIGAREVFIVYRRGMKELPARLDEVRHAQEEGIVFKTLSNPVAVLSDGQGWVRGLDCVEMTLGEPDESGRRRPVEKPDSRFSLKVDTVIVAVGTTANPLVRMTTPGLQCDRYGCIVTDRDGMSSRPGVFAGGDAVTGSATVILAMGAGKTAARAMDRYIRAKAAAG